VENIYPFTKLNLAFALVAGVVFAGLGGCGSSTQGPPIDDASLDAAVVDAGMCPASCDDSNDCTLDSCDPSTFQCVHQAVADGTSCEDGNACSSHDVCQGGLCYSGPYITCTALDQCHVAGACSPRTGVCSNPNAPDGRACNDGLANTTSDQCSAGVCAGTPIMCADGRPADPVNGSCPNGFPNSLSAQVFTSAQGPSNGNGLLRTSTGLVFTAGTFADTTDLGSGPLTTDVPRGKNNTDVFIAQIDPSTQKAIWAQSFPGPQVQLVTAFAANGTGQLGLVGSMQGGMTVGGTEVDALYAGDQFILGANAKDGTGLWVNRYNFQGNLSKTLVNGLRGIAGDSQSGVFVVCGTTTKDASDLSASLKGAWHGGQDIVLAGIDGTSGNILWAAQVGGTNDEGCDGVAMDTESKIYAIGTYRFASVVSFGSLTLPVVSKVAPVPMYVVKLDSTGQGMWSAILGDDTQTIVPSAMALVGSDILVAGSVSFGNLSLNGVDLGGAPTFVARLSGSTGKVVWIAGLGAGGNLRVTAIAEGANGTILLTGNYFLAAKLGTSPMPAPNTQGGLFVAQLLFSDGTVRVARGYGDPAYGSSAAGAVARTDGAGSESGSSLLLGLFGTSMDLGPQVGILTNPLTTPGASALFLAKLTP